MVGSLRDSRWKLTNFSSPIYFPSFENFIQYLIDANIDEALSHLIWAYELNLNML